ncbi:MAG: mannose-phosphate guanylyltransferase [Cryptosporangiaceae bacterium]|nr:mannose-phosphate guanylyltransferase [Cryptosporangiaceae bacterium]
MTFYAVIPAGGAGTRLWPLSRAGHPKFLHALGTGGRSLIQATADRLRPLAELDRILVVTGGAHAAAIARQLPDLPEENVLVEPGPRDSAPAIGLAAALIARRDPDAIMGSFAADHLVADPVAYEKAVRIAIEAAADGHLVTIGITPTSPETGFGYIRCGSPLGTGGALSVEEFKEKPSADVARSYLESGKYVWNAGMFVWRVSAVLAEIERQLPELAAGLSRIAAAWDSARREEVLAETWPHLPKISIDHGVMEGAAARGLVATVPGSFGWNDVGDWDTLATVLPGDSDGNVVTGGGSLVAVDTKGAIVSAGSGRTIALLGLRDIVVVDTPDAVLVCPRDRSQQVKHIVDELKSRGDASLL